MDLDASRRKRRNGRAVRACKKDIPLARFVPALASSYRLPGNSTAILHFLHQQDTPWAASEG